MCRLFLQSKSTYHVLLAVLCREIEWCKGNCVVVIYENTARLSTLRQGGRVKRKYKGASLRTHGTSADSCVPKTPLATGSLQAACLQSLREHPNRWHRASSLPFSTCLILSEEESWLGNSQYPSFPTTRFLPLNQRIMHSKRVTETSASSITTITPASLPPHPHGRHPSRRSPFRRDQAPHIYVHPTEDARTSFSRVRLLLNARYAPRLCMSSGRFACAWT
jgi:hypothetical protein